MGLWGKCGGDPRAGAPNLDWAGGHSRGKAREGRGLSLRLLHSLRLTPSAVDKGTFRRPRGCVHLISLMSCVFSDVYQ